MRHYKSKKADLSLSTNAIVILILAITILGLGLTFVRGLFKQAESKITEVTSSTELANPPTRDNPMTVSPGQLTIRKNEVGKVLIAYMQNQVGSQPCTLTRPFPVTSLTSTFSFNTQIVTMDQDKITIWTVAVTPLSSLTVPKTELVSFKMTCDTKEQTKDLVLTITA